MTLRIFCRRVKEIAINPCLVPHPYSHTDELLAEPWSDFSLDPPLLASSIQIQINGKTNFFLRHAIFKCDLTAHKVTVPRSVGLPLTELDNGTVKYKVVRWCWHTNDVGSFQKLGVHTS